jgi:GNAT superfamily N-acetyltransferase
MKIIYDCILSILNNSLLQASNPFLCGDKDLDDFFHNDVDNYAKQLLGKTYCFLSKKEKKSIIVAFTLSNASIDARHLPNNRKKKLTKNIPYEKNMSSYPAILIGRLGVNKEYAGKGIGTELLEFIKQWILAADTKSGCRYLIVDSYNRQDVLHFYESNGFKTLFSSEQQEKEYIGLMDDKPLKTCLMYFDLIVTQLTKGE